MEYIGMNKFGAVVVAGVMVASGVAISAMASDREALPVLTESSAIEGEYQIDNTHSSVLFKVGYFGVTNFYGRFDEVSGVYDINMENPSSSKLEMTVPAESVNSNNEGRDRHLGGPDFFSSKEFPEMSFVAKSFEKVDDKTLKVTGDFTMRGKTQEETATLTWMGERDDPRGGLRSGWEATMTVNRSDYGVNYGVENGALGDETTIITAITGMRR